MSNDHDHRTERGTGRSATEPIVDVRPLAAYNGWRRNGEARGGHIPGAVAFPAAWLRTVDEAEIRRLLAEKGITADRDVVVYGDGADDAAEFVAALTALGIEGVARLRGRGHGLGRRSDRCRSSGCRSTRQLVHIPWLRDVLDGETARGAADREVPALPRQLRGPRGVRRGPHPGRALPRHELARGPGRLEPPLARGHRRGPRARSASPPTRRSSSTAATPRVTPTRSGRAAGPARSRRPGR